MAASEKWQNPCFMLVVPGSARERVSRKKVHVVFISKFYFALFWKKTNFAECQHTHNWSKQKEYWTGSEAAMKHYLYVRKNIKWRLGIEGLPVSTYDTTPWVFLESLESFSSLSFLFHPPLLFSTKKTLIFFINLLLCTLSFLGAWCVPSFRSSPILNQALISSNTKENQFQFRTRNLLYLV